VWVKKKRGKKKRKKRREGRGPLSLDHVSGWRGKKKRGGQSFQQKRRENARSSPLDRGGKEKKKKEREEGGEGFARVYQVGCATPFCSRRSNCKREKKKGEGADGTAFGPYFLSKKIASRGRAFLWADVGAIGSTVVPSSIGGERGGKKKEEGGEKIKAEKERWLRSAFFLSSHACCRA